MAKKKRQLPPALKANADKLKRGESLRKKSSTKKATRKRK